MTALMRMYDQTRVDENIWSYLIRIYHQFLPEYVIDFDKNIWSSFIKIDGQICLEHMIGFHENIWWDLIKNISSRSIQIANQIWSEKIINLMIYSDLKRFSHYICRNCHISISKYLSISIFVRFDENLWWDLIRMYDQISSIYD